MTAYQKLFKGKQVKTAHGLMTVHKIRDKVLVEFPIKLLGKDMMLTSSIENISDNGWSDSLPDMACRSVLPVWIRPCRPGYS